MPCEVRLARRGVARDDLSVPDQLPVPACSGQGLTSLSASHNAMHLAFAPTTLNSAYCRASLMMLGWMLAVEALVEWESEDEDEGRSRCRNSCSGSATTAGAGAGVSTAGFVLGDGLGVEDGPARGRRAVGVEAADGGALPESTRAAARRSAFDDAFGSFFSPFAFGGGGVDCFGDDMSACGLGELQHTRRDASQAIV